MQGLTTSREVAAYLGVHPQSMDRWASQGKGPRYTKIEGVRRYDWADVHAWIEQNKDRNPDGPEWRCSTCRKPVTHDGHLIVSIDHAVLNAEKADWGVLHYDCPQPGIPNPYTIEIERVATWSQLANWTAHLWEKEWMHNTDWSSLLRRAGANR